MLRDHADDLIIHLALPVHLDGGIVLFDGAQHLFCLPQLALSFQGSCLVHVQVLQISQHTFSHH